ncbi:hypothetical protein N7468_000043 [Penicillium chermesinum]|uniref:AB hydrolase-1 domain-containing protein n=1 Tax=Penicillium chermesinum TaxID=63820 RepID=A0A9W9PJK7_9EURO|nr:uncharacterized protein N7468_000043 [Penicillium chermesinum]KAJ5248592.1 hypothetical protein N7468_000043 [Penicillium chermesinum]
MTAWETARKLFFIPNPSRLWSLVSCLRLRAISGSNRKVAWFGNALLGTQGGHLTSDATGEQPGRPEIRVLRSNAPFIHITRTQKRPSPYADPARWSRNRFSRPLFTESLPPFLIPPAIFVGLLLSLWTWKCMWIIIMQNKLLYLSWLPPFSRSDKISEYESECRPVLWSEHTIRSLDNTKLALCQGYIPATPGHSSATPGQWWIDTSSITPAITGFESIRRCPHFPDETSYTVAALSYRGYWTSSGRATQSGIEADAQAFLMHVSERFSPCQIVLWGHSLGAAVAASALLERLSQNATHAREEDRAPIRGLIMEAPISNIKDMLISLYPQKWLPYRYLWPFSWNSWCNYTNLERLAALRSQKVDQSRGVPQTADCRVPPILILSPENDEVIPPTVAEQLEHQGKSLGLDVRRQNIRGAMHTEVPTKPEGKKALVEFIIRTTHDPPRG